MSVALLCPSLASARESRYASIIIDAETGQVLSAVQPDRRSYPASLTKMMTLYLLFDELAAGRLRLDSTLPVSRHASNQAPSKLGLGPGDRIKVEDAVLALVTKSANDVAVVVAEAIGGSEANFATLMTAKARTLGMKGTVYRNASGLPNPGQVSTARDQALLSRALIRQHARYYRYFATRNFEWNGQHIASHNRLMLNYPGADGIKTGYIAASGFNLAASAVRDGRRLIGVVFGGDTAGWRDRRMAQLLDSGFARLNGGSVVEMAAVEDGQPDEDEPPAAKPAKAAKAKAKDREKDKEKLLTQATLKVPAPRPAAKRDADGAWAIQVGAFAGLKPARQAAAGAAKRLGGLVARASIDIDESRNGRNTVYRARLIGFTEDQARAACRKLAKAKRECRVVTPDA
jgi:D-alanyl-D-alanine carboxypeptidase